MKFSQVILGIYVLLTLNLEGQTILFEESFLEELAQMELTFIPPLEGDFKIRPNENLRILEIDQTLWSKSEKLEVRIALVSVAELGELAELPDMAARLLVMDIASNDEYASPIAIHRFGDEEMAHFQADWARQYTFQPKPGQIPFQTVQLTALFRRGRGMAYLIMAFNRAPETLDARQKMLRFKEN
ncbi:MAG: hypothetical protein AAF741_16410 [Bacteroidota bacterium]